MQLMLCSLHCIALVQSCVSPDEGIPFKIILLMIVLPGKVLLYNFHKDPVCFGSCSESISPPSMPSLLSFHFCKNIPNQDTPHLLHVNLIPSSIYIFFHLKHCKFHLQKFHLGLFLFSVSILNIFGLSFFCLPEHMEYIYNKYLMSSSTICIICIISWSVFVG